MAKVCPHTRNPPVTVWGLKLDTVFRPDLAAFHAYHVPDSQGMVKLDAMENPFALPPTLQHQLGEALGRAALNRYPDPQARDLAHTLRQTFGIGDELGLILGNGSDELIQLLIQAVAQDGASVLSVEPSFVMYRMLSAINRVNYIGVPLAADFSLDLPAMLASIQQHRPALCFLAYPNNPTGNAFDPAAIEAIIQAAAPGLVVIDEAYQAFARDSFLPRLSQHSNVLLMRTVSKLGLAGLRLGYMVGRPDLIHDIDKLRLPYNINILTQLAAKLVLEQHGVLDEQTAQLVEERHKLFDALRELPGFTPYPSEANFILVRVPDAPSRFEALKQRGILVKNLHHAHPLLANCLRLTIGTPAENALMLKALAAPLS
jgi:histidinol-phosphate aminotransferase